ncbi:MAG: hypothetical protein AVDCRST_MAG56-3171, partial [uncultured Cytophagales bacterium]
CLGVLFRRHRSGRRFLGEGKGFSQTAQGGKRKVSRRLSRIRAQMHADFGLQGSLAG